MLEAIGIAIDVQLELFRLLAGLLHLGNIDFDGDDEAVVGTFRRRRAHGASDAATAAATAAACADSHGGADAASKPPGPPQPHRSRSWPQLPRDADNLSPGAPLAAASTLLGLSNLESCLISRQLRGPGGEAYSIQIGAAAAALSRDAVAKAVYGRLFEWVVAGANRSTAPADDDDDGTPGNGSGGAGGGTSGSGGNGFGGIGSGESGSGRYIGMLDVYGFESFEVNSFEQLCINLTNEKLQHFFLLRVFRAEEELYALEGVTWTPLSWEDNSGCVALVEGGVLRVLDETCRRPGGPTTRPSRRR